VSGHISFGRSACLPDAKCHSRGRPDDASHGICLPDEECQGIFLTDGVTLGLYRNRSVARIKGNQATSIIHNGIILDLVCGFRW